MKLGAWITVQAFTKKKKKQRIKTCPIYQMLLSIDIFTAAVFKKKKKAYYVCLNGKPA